LDKRILKGRPAEEREAFIESCQHNDHIVQALKDYVLHRLDEKHAPLSRDDYDVANWSHLAADRNGEIRAFREMFNALESIKPRSSKGT
jgi:hypothetical protein